MVGRVWFCGGNTTFNRRGVEGRRKRPEVGPAPVPKFGYSFDKVVGGALNSTLSAGTITLAPRVINLQLLLGVQQSGSFKFFLNIEVLP